MRVLIRKILRYIKWTFNYFYNHYLYIRYHRSHHSIETDNEYKPTVLINLRTNIIRDSISNLVIWLVNSGYKVFIKDTFLFVGSMSKLDRLIFEIDGLHLVSKNPERVKLHMTNRSEKIESDYRLEISTDYWQSENESSWHLPEGMHPYMYYRNYIPDLSKIQIKNNRRIGIFFSGNLSPDIYNQEIIKTKFGLLTRLEIIEFIKAEMQDSIIFPESKDDLNKKELRNKVVINEYQKVGIRQDEYIEFLGNCNFFLFTPGVAMPLCRNNFESMAAGCIPIIQYAHYHYPPLEHGKNCIVFSDRDDLIDKIKFALSLDEQNLSLMRKEVINYYNSFIDNKAIIANLEERLASGTLQKLLILQG